MVEIASSDNEEGVATGRSNNEQIQIHQAAQKKNIVSVPASEKPLQRSFWKAGAYDINSTKLAPAPGFISSIFRLISLSCVVCFDH